MANHEQTNEAIYDAKVLGTGKTLVLGLQHLFAMFGATVLVPVITGLNVSTTLLFAGLGTLLFHLITGRKVPAFLGSSFAFLGAYGLTTAAGQNIPLTYSGFGVAVAGLIYLVLALLFKIFGTKKVMKFFPPIVTGPIIICIGLTLAGSAITNCHTNWLVALAAIVVVVVCNLFGKGMIKTARSSLIMGWFPCAAAVLGSPNAQGKPPQHIHLPLGGRTAPGKARSGRRFLGTNGATLWLWSCLPKPGAPGP